MDRLLITGGRRLAGTVAVSGAKNSALKLMAAALLAPGETVIQGAPRIADCLTMSEVLEHLGAARHLAGLHGRGGRVRRRWDRGALRAGPRHARVHRGPGAAARPPRPGPRGHAGRLQHRLAQDRPAPEGPRADGRHVLLRARLPAGRGAAAARGVRVARLPERRRDRERPDGRRRRDRHDRGRERRPRAGDPGPGRDAHRDGREDRGRRHHDDRDPGNGRAACRDAPRGPGPRRGRHVRARGLRDGGRGAAAGARAPTTWTCSWRSSPTRAPPSTSRTTGCAWRWPAGRRRSTS